MKKGLKVLSIVGLTAVSIGAVSALASCGSKEKFYIWGPEEVIDDLEGQVNDWLDTLDEEEYEDFTSKYKLTYSSVSESNAAEQLQTDVGAAGSVYFFPQDQLARLISSNLIQPVSSTFASDVRSRNDSGSIAAATAGSTLYAFPITSDNGFFVYYDATALNSYVSTLDDGTTVEDVIGDQTKLIAAATALSMTINFNLAEDGGWYNAAYFFGAGATSEWGLSSDGSFYAEGVTDTYNSDAGLLACAGMAELINSGVWVDGSSASGFSESALVVVDGTWDYNAANEALATREGGHELGCAPLWTVTVSADTLSTITEDTTYQLYTFTGNKLIGTKPEEDGEKNAYAQSIANYLSDYDCQMDRFNKHAWGPSNLKAQESEAVQENPALVALNTQFSLGGVPQGNYPDEWWYWAAEIGCGIRTNEATDEDAWASILATYGASLTEYIDSYL
ncbi:MAG: extracellular solute-binding protein [Coprobacillus sp.]|nr:extracellular solute-binding protein [Coprobacillus sp.]